MRKRFIIGTAILFIGIGFCWFRFWRNQQPPKESQLKLVDVPEPPPRTDAPRMVTVDQMPTEKLFEILAAPRARSVTIVTNKYNGAPAVQPFIESTIIEQANRMNSIFHFARNADGTPKTLTLEDLAYSATTMTGTFKFNFVTRPDFVFMVNYDHGVFEIFADTRFDSDVFDRNMLKYEALRRATNYISKEQAVALVEDTFRNLGYDRDALKKFGEPYVRQLAFTPQGKQHVLPYFFIDYRDPESESEPKSALLSAEVLGIEPGGRITRLSDYFWKLPPIPLPEGYREKVESYWRSQGKTPPRF